MLTTMIYLRSGITNLKQFIYGLMAAFCVTSVAQEVCRPPLIFFDVHREELKDGWLHTTGGSAYETRITEVDYYDNRPIVDSLFSSQGQVTLTNVSSTSRISDLGMIFANWGMVGVTDINDDGITDGIDLGILLENWTG